MVLIWGWKFSVSIVSLQFQFLPFTHYSSNWINCLQNGYTETKYIKFGSDPRLSVDWTFRSYSIFYLSHYLCVCLWIIRSVERFISFDPDFFNSSFSQVYGSLDCSYYIVVTIRYLDFIVVVSTVWLLYLIVVLVTVIIQFLSLYVCSYSDRLWASNYLQRSRRGKKLVFLYLYILEQS